MELLNGTYNNTVSWLHSLHVSIISHFGTLIRQDLLIIVTFCNMFNDSGCYRHELKTRDPTFVDVG